VATWKLFALAYKASRGWKRLPPEQRKKILTSAQKQARKHGPTVARKIGAAVRQARKGR
jgi:acyl-CoA reductase-like NAD-dependent aldehyde dehydrogenase